MECLDFTPLKILTVPPLLGSHIKNLSTRNGLISVVTTEGVLVLGRGEDSIDNKSGDLEIIAHFPIGNIKSFTDPNNKESNKSLITSKSNSIIGNILRESHANSRIPHPVSSFFVEHNEGYHHFGSPFSHKKQPLLCIVPSYGTCVVLYNLFNIMNRRESFWPSKPYRVFDTMEILRSYGLLPEMEHKGNLGKRVLAIPILQTDYSTKKKVNLATLYDSSVVLWCTESGPVIVLKLSIGDSEFTTFNVIVNDTSILLYLSDEIGNINVGHFSTISSLSATESNSRINLNNNYVKETDLSVICADRWKTIKLGFEATYIGLINLMCLVSPFTMNKENHHLIFACNLCRVTLFSEHLILIKQITILDPIVSVYPWYGMILINTANGGVVAWKFRQQKYGDDIANPQVDFQYIDEEEIITDYAHPYRRVLAVNYSSMDNCIYRITLDAKACLLESATSPIPELQSIRYLVDSIPSLLSNQLSVEGVIGTIRKGLFDTNRGQHFTLTEDFCIINKDEENGDFCVESIIMGNSIEFFEKYSRIFLTYSMKCGPYELNMDIDTVRDTEYRSIDLLPKDQISDIVFYRACYILNMILMEKALSPVLRNRLRIQRNIITSNIARLYFNRYTTQQHIVDPSDPEYVIIQKITRECESNDINFDYDSLLTNGIDIDIEMEILNKNKISQIEENSLEERLNYSGNQMISPRCVSCGKSFIWWITYFTEYCMYCTGRYVMPLGY